MNFLKNILTLFFLLIIASFSSGQLTVTGSTYLDPEAMDISEAQFDQILDASKKVMKDYHKFGTLLDPQSGTVTQQSIKNYNNLFSNGAKIVNDLSRRLLSDRSYKDYASQVQDYLRKDGVKYEMFGALINEVTYDSAGFFRVIVLTEKTLYNGLEIDNSKLTCRTGRLYGLSFTLIVDEKNLNKAEIFKIRGSIKRKCEDASTYFGGYVSYGKDLLGVSNFNSSQNFPSIKNVDYSDFNIKVSSPSSVNFGGSYYKPLTRAEKLFLSLNFGYFMTSLNTDINGTYFFDDKETTANNITDPNSFETTYHKFVRMNGTESIRLHSIEIPIGILYRKQFSTNEKIAFGGYVLLVPAIAIGQSNTTKLDQLDYWAAINFGEDNLGVNFQDDITNPLLSEDLKSFGFAEGQTISAEPELSTGFSLGARVAPFIQISINESNTTFLEFAVEYTHRFSALIEHESTDQLLLQDIGDDLQGLDEELSQSILESHFSDSKYSTLGFKIGFIFKRK